MDFVAFLEIRVIVVCRLPFLDAAILCPGVDQDATFGAHERTFTCHKVFRDI
jgi:hypothetical protein